MASSSQAKSCGLFLSAADFRFRSRVGRFQSAICSLVTAICSKTRSIVDQELGAFLHLGLGVALRFFLAEDRPARAATKGASPRGGARRASLHARSSVFFAGLGGERGPCRRRLALDFRNAAPEAALAPLSAH